MPVRHPRRANGLDSAAGPRVHEIVLGAGVLDRFLSTADAIHEAGLKSFGLFVADPGAEHYPYCATDVVFFDPAKNRRNDPGLRPAFEAQGRYFRAHDDAGFVADSGELFAVHRRLEELGLEPVGMFHSHRRQPANFSHIDFRLHSPAYSWHLIVSLRDVRRPVLRAYGVEKDVSVFGIEPDDGNEGSEHSYAGPEVWSLRIEPARRAA